MTDPFAQRLALHNAAAELEALRAEGRGMVWQNERDLHEQNSPRFSIKDFDALAARIRATKVAVDDAVLLQGIRG